MKHTWPVYQTPRVRLCRSAGVVVAQVHNVVTVHFVFAHRQRLKAPAESLGALSANDVITSSDR